MKILSTVLALSLALSPLAFGNEVKNEVKKDEELIRTVLKPLEKRGIKIGSIQPLTDLKVPGFDGFIVEVIDEGNARKIKRYIWVSKDGKYIALNLLEVTEVKGDKILKPLQPKNAVSPLKMDLSWLKSVDEKLNKAGIPHVIGKGDKKLYIVWDVFCPFCYRHFNQFNEETAKKLDVELHLIPFAVHGERSIKGFVHFAKLAKEKGIEETFKHLYSLGNGNFRKYSSEIQKEMKKEGEDKELAKVFKELKDTLAKNKVRATPTIIFIPSGNEGYIFVGFRPLEEVVKLK
ncbi:DsbA family protein [Phorcysia thermohydrogeniphila]|uniref:Thiol:disulfide interchange protein DsbC n=1 Tax=Phorcysia thermohydrogeniphila TaxID=936138 RepID=A0A4V6NCX8_9BACT|nr:thioredoxin domain-containing protein [Phorcysia thermohydrogeniphila]TCK04586.1 thiol:disulfide interchange protein DsbC [Phorcysia thermohydrogeniphila]